MALNAYLTLKGQKQGDIGGSPEGPGTQYSGSLLQPGDPQTL